MATQSSTDSEVDVEADVSYVHSLAARLKRRLTEWIDDRHYRCWHDRLVEDVRRKGEFEELLEALGMTAEQFERSRIRPIVAAELSQRMLHQLGCDLRIAPMDILVVTQRCRACDSWRNCRRWLDRGGSGADYRDFCPNAEVFDRLRELETPFVTSRN
jgi:hypothetical protein